MLLSRGPNSLGTPGEGGGGPDWLDEGATDGVNYTLGQAYLGGVLITDLSTIHGGGFDPAAVTGDGMAVLDANANRPTATGALFDKLIAADYCTKIELETLDYSSHGFSEILSVDSNTDYRGSGDGFDIGFGATLTPGELYASDFSGDYNTVGIVSENATNIIVVSLNTDGFLASLNGATAVLSSPAASMGVPVVAWIGCVGATDDQPLNGSIQRIIFYPNGKTAEEVEALATPDWVLAARAPSGDLPLVYDDMENARYWRADIGVCAETDMHVENTDYGAWNPAIAIYPGNGYRATPPNTTPAGQDSYFPTCSPGVFALISSGATALLEVKNAAQREGSFCEFDFVNANAQYNGGIARNDTGMEIYDTISTGENSGAWANGRGRFVLTVTDEETTGSLNGSPINARGGFLSDLPPILAGLAGPNDNGDSYLAKTIIYPPQPDTDLPTLSAL